MSLDDPVLLYVKLTHNAPKSTIRLMESVYVPGVTKFVIHVNGKEKSDATHERLAEYAKERSDEEYTRIILYESGSG